MSENVSILFDVWELGTSAIAGNPEIKRKVNSFLSNKEADLCVGDLEERPGEPGYIYRYEIKTSVVPSS